jgi:hypothetical protein
MYLCVARCMDYFRCSNSKNLYVFMFHPMLYGVFHPFSSMLSILHVKSIYNVNKSLSIIFMIFVDVPRFFYTLQTPKLTASVTGKTGPINWQNRSINQNSVRFTAMIQTF